MEILHNLIKPIYEILVLIPMPFRVIVLLMPVYLFLHWLLFRKVYWLIHIVLEVVSFIFFNAIKVFLLPQVPLLKILRERKIQIPHLIYFADSIFRNTIYFLYFIKGKAGKLAERISEKKYSLKFKWFMLIMFLFTCIWHLRFLLGSSSLGELLDNIFLKWNLIERWALTGKSSVSMSTPTKAVKEYFLDVRNKKIEDAWNKTSQNFHNDRNLMPGGYAEYKDWWSNKVSKIHVNSIYVQNNYFDTANVKVNFNYVYSKTGKLANKTVVLYLVLDSRTGKWIIDSSKN